MSEIKKISIRLFDKYKKVFYLPFLIVIGVCQIAFAKDIIGVAQFRDLLIVDEKGEEVPINSTPKPEDVYHLSFTINNFTNQKVTYQLYTGKNQQAILSIGNRVLKGGKYTPTSQRVHKRHFYFLPIQINPHDSIRVKLTLRNAVGYSNNRQLLAGDIHTPDWNEVAIYSEKGYLEKVAEIEGNDASHNLIIFVFLGAIGFTALFIALLFLLNRQLSFFYYSAYLLCFFAFGLFHTRHYSPVGLYLSEFPVFHQLFPESIIWIGMFFYGYFSIHLLEVRKSSTPYVRLFIVSISWFSLIAGCLMAVPLLWTNNLQLNLDIVQWIRYLYSPMGFVGMVLLLWKVKSKLKYLLVAGVALWAILGNYSSTYAINDGYQLTSVGLGSNDALLWTCSGLLLESVMFSFAIGVKVRNTERERLQNKERLIEKMSELQQLKERENVILEQKVKEKTEELIKAYELVENQKKRELEQSFQKRLALSEMDALRSQMNPHFMFNSLNSIKHLVLSNENKKASGYLSKFAKLLRQILTFSRKERIALEDELKNVELYLELESQRFGDSFSFEINKENISPYLLEEIEIPSMLLQPFVENALLHGLRNSTKKDKWIKIYLNEFNEQVLITIEDNGIGREAAMKLKSNHSESLGTKITEERVALYNETYLDRLSITIQDKPTGTVVEIRI